MRVRSRLMALVETCFDIILPFPYHEQQELAEAVGLYARRRERPWPPYGSAGYADTFCFTLYSVVTPAFTFALVFM
jgi:hypothetical protein